MVKLSFFPLAAGFDVLEKVIAASWDVIMSALSKQGTTKLIAAQPLPLRDILKGGNS